VELDRDYRYAVVGEPSRKYLWILGRRPEMEDGTYAMLTDRARALGFDTSRLLRTPQSGR
jgi:apolipoprotein D and lipocalin family protein